MSFTKLSDIVNAIQIKHEDISYIVIEVLIILTAAIVGKIYFNLSGLIIAATIFFPAVIISLMYHFYRASEKSLVYQQQKLQDYLTIFHNIDFRTSVPYMTGYAASPEFARVTYETVIERKPKLIVELGGGISSIIMGYAIEQNGFGSLISIDHKKKYMQQTRSQIKKHELDKYVTFEHAPLMEQQINTNFRIWYDLSNITFDEPIDLLVIDGPPEPTEHKARYPALPTLGSHLSDSATIILDDAKRRSSKNIIKDWKHEFRDFTFNTIDTDRGIAVISK